MCWLKRDWAAPKGVCCCRFLEVVFGACGNLWEKKEVAGIHKKGQHEGSIFFFQLPASVLDIGRRRPLGCCKHVLHVLIFNVAIVHVLTHRGDKARLCWHIHATFPEWEKVILASVRKSNSLCHARSCCFGTNTGGASARSHSNNTTEQIPSITPITRVRI